MITIYKYQLSIRDCGYLEIPKRAKILSCQTQYNAELEREIICIWAIINTENPLERKYFYIFGTGQELKYEGYSNLKYLNTCKLHKDSLTLHIFEEESHI